MRPKVHLRAIRSEREASLACRWFENNKSGVFLTNDVREHVRERHLIEISDKGQLLLFCDADDKPFGLGTFKSKGNPRNLELSILVGDETLWETGVGGLAAARLIDYLFLTLDAHRVFALTLAVNPHAIGTLKTGQFKLEARLRDHYFVDGNFEDCLVWGQTIEEYKETLKLCAPESVFAVVPAIPDDFRERSKKLLSDVSIESVVQ